MTFDNMLPTFKRERPFTHKITVISTARPWRWALSVHIMGYGGWKPWTWWLPMISLNFGQQLLPNVDITRISQCQIGCIWIGWRWIGCYWLGCYRLCCCQIECYWIGWCQIECCQISDFMSPGLMLLAWMLLGLILLLEMACLFSTPLSIILSIVDIVR